MQKQLQNKTNPMRTYLAKLQVKAQSDKSIEARMNQHQKMVESFEKFLAECLMLVSTIEAW